MHYICCFTYKDNRKKLFGAIMTWIIFFNILTIYAPQFTYEGEVLNVFVKTLIGVVFAIEMSYYNGPHNKTIWRTYSGGREDFMVLVDISYGCHLICSNEMLTGRYFQFKMSPLNTTSFAHCTIRQDRQRLDASIDSRMGDCLTRKNAQ